MSMLGKTWQVSYGNASVPCKTENDAKLLARELVKKVIKSERRHSKVKSPVRIIAYHQIFAWLAES